MIFKKVLQSVLDLISLGYPIFQILAETTKESLI